MHGKVLKKTAAIFMAAAISAGSAAILPIQTVSAASENARQIEALDRGLTAIKSGNGVFLSWRLLGTESYDTAFAVYRNGIKISDNITDSTNYYDNSGTTNDSYFVRTIKNGKEISESDSVKPWGQNYLDIPINKPGSIYSANDATAADVDGDGQYEIILKWDPSDSQDNSKSGYTSNVYIDCYELDGTQKWRIDLGKNIRAGAHYTQFIAYDFNGDGKAELAMKTADGTVAGDGTVIGDSSKDYRNSGGYILSGPEYLTMFEGETGKILQTINYEPQRGNVSDWGDKYGNRVDRFLAGVAYLDGKTPSLIMCRGYYTRAVIVAYDFKNGSFSRKWTFDSNNSGCGAYAGQGSHSLSIADVDDDGYDEIVYGSAVIDHNGNGLYSTGMGHGDALHVGDFDPDHQGLEVYQVHEDKSSNIESIQMRDAKTGSTLWSVKTGTDVGRGLIANIGPDYYPYVAIASTGIYDKNGNKLDLNLGKFGINFAIYWDGDLYREGLDRTYINKWNYNTKSIDRLLTGSNVHSNNGTKATPTLSADILGDWREEVIWPLSDDSALRVYMSDSVTNHKLYTLMHDTQYREAIAWQNVAYNQPPHTSYYIGEDMKTPEQPNVYTVGTYKEKQVEQNTEPKKGAYIPEGKYMIQNVENGMYLDVAGGTAANGTNVQMWGASGPGKQNTWNIKSAGNGYYQIYSCVGDGSYLLDLDYGKKDNGTNIQIYQNTYCDAQLFKFVEESNGKYVIATKVTNDASNLDVYGHSLNSGANVCQWSYTGADNQLWKLIEVKDKESIEKASVSLSYSSVNYSGNECKPDVTVTYNGKTLELNKDYSVSYSNNVNVGTATVTITGIGDYTGTVTKNFQITQNQKSLSNCTITLNKTVFKSTGKAIKPRVTVKDGEKVLTAGTDYIVRYDDNTDPGTASVIIAGRGSYTGRITKTFKILDSNAKNISECSITLNKYSFNYTGKGIKPRVTVKDGSTVLTNTVDYNIRYVNNINKGTATVVVSGTGKYQGIVSKTFTIL